MIVSTKVPVSSIPCALIKARTQGAAARVGGPKLPAGSLPSLLLQVAGDYDLLALRQTLTTNGGAATSFAGDGSGGGGGGNGAHPWAARHGPRLAWATVTLAAMDAAAERAAQAAAQASAAGGGPAMLEGCGFSADDSVPLVCVTRVVAEGRSPAVLAALAASGLSATADDGTLARIPDGHLDRHAASAAESTDEKNVNFCFAVYGALSPGDFADCLLLRCECANELERDTLVDGISLLIEHAREINESC